MTTFFAAPDGAGEPTIWEATDRDPAVVVRRAEMPGPHADLLWRVLVGVLTADDETVERVARRIYPGNWDAAAVHHEAYREAHREDARAVLAALRSAD